jgi:protein-L-isoaspartate O-methyltransferase
VSDPAVLVRRMVENLTTDGFLDPGWREAFLAVPRHAFIPDLVWQEQRRDLVPFHRAEDPDRWLRLAYAPRQIMITQVDDGHPVGPGLIGDCISSSASQPNVVALMLAALGAQPGMTVCEIGTGTGYNAALLAQRLGADHITTIEVDPGVATQARATLARTGSGPSWLSPATARTGTRPEHPTTGSCRRQRSSKCPPRGWRRPGRAGGWSRRGEPRTSTAPCSRSPWASRAPRVAAWWTTWRSCGCATSASRWPGFVTACTTRTTPRSAPPTSTPPGSPTTITRRWPSESWYRIANTATAGQRMIPVSTRCGFSTRAPDPGPVSTTHPAAAATKSTSWVPAVSGTRSKPPTPGGYRPVARRRSGGVLP